MTSQSNLKKFNNIYDETYYDILKYIIIKCNNINDANDIIQEVYLEFWNILNKKKVEEDNIKSYLIGIAVNKIKKHYSILSKIKRINIFDKNNNIDLINNIKDDIDIEDLVIKNDDWDIIWRYIKNKKNKDIGKVFYLYYKLELFIKEIACELNKSESYVKNLIYRTLKELCSLFGKECD